MMSTNLADVAGQQVLYLTTTGRKSGRPREIEIWFVAHCGRFYLFAETGEAAHWVRNIQHEPKVTLRIGGQQLAAMARVLDCQSERDLCDQVADIAKRKYGWGDGLPVEIRPLVQPAG